MYTISFIAKGQQSYHFRELQKTTLIVHKSNLAWPFPYLDDFDIRVKSRWQTKMQDPVQPGSKKKDNVSLEKSSSYQEQERRRWVAIG